MFWWYEIGGGISKLRDEKAMRQLVFKYLGGLRLLVNSGFASRY